MVRTPDRKCCNPYTPEHILVMEKHIGRQLRSGFFYILSIEVDNQIIPFAYNPTTRNEAEWYQKQTINALEKIIKTESAMKE